MGRGKCRRVEGQESRRVGEDLADQRDEADDRVFERQVESEEAGDGGEGRAPCQRQEEGRRGIAGETDEEMARILPIRSTVTATSVSPPNSETPMTASRGESRDFQSEGILEPNAEDDVDGFVGGADHGHCREAGQCGGGRENRTKALKVPGRFAWTGPPSSSPSLSADTSFA